MAGTGRRTVLYRVQGDSEPKIVVKYPGDLTSYTITMRAKNMATGSKETYTGVIISTSLTESVVEFGPFSATDIIVATAGLYEIEYKFVLGGQSFTIPQEDTIVVETREDLI